MDITKELQKIMIDRDLTQKMLADKLDTTQANLSKKFKLNNYRIQELEELVKLMGYKIEINFIKIDDYESEN